MASRLLNEVSVYEARRRKVVATLKRWSFINLVAQPVGFMNVPVWSTHIITSVCQDIVAKQAVNQARETLLARLRCPGTDWVTMWGGLTFTLPAAVLLCWAIVFYNPISTRS